MVRLVWNPKKSNLVDETVDEIVRGIERGSIPNEINPMTLVNLGDKFQKFYFASFRRVDRSKWAEDRFPSTPDDVSGFESFVRELNGRLERGVINVKQYVPMYFSHTQDEISRILNYRDMYLAGDIEREDALVRLEHDFAIELSESRIDHYFPNRVNGNRGTLDQLISRLNRARKEIDIDLSNVDCLKGMMFEGMVGIYLMEQHGPEDVQSQVRKPVIYRDLAGVPHGQVFLDYIAGGQNYEVKLHNTLENILDSILPQTFALEQESGVPVKSVVVCRTKNEELDAMVHEGILLEREAEQMGIHEVGRPIGDILDYVVFEDLIDDSLNFKVYNRGLSVLDSVGEQDILRIKSYLKSLDRIQDNPDGLTQKYSILVSKMESGEVLGGEDIATLFGTRKQGELSNDAEKRISIIKSNEQKQKKRMLISMYSLREPGEYEELTDEMVASLMGLNDGAFNKLCRGVMEERQQKRKSRGVSKETSIDDILGFHNRAYERRRKEAIKIGKFLGAKFEDDLIDKQAAYLKRIGFYSTQGTPRFYNNEMEVLHRFIERNSGGSFDLGDLISTLERGAASFTGFYNELGDLAARLGQKVMIDSQRGGLLEGPEIFDSISAEFATRKGEMDQNRLRLQNSDPLHAEIIKLNEQARNRSISTTKREREILRRYSGLIEGRPEELSLDATDFYFNYLSELGQVSSITNLTSIDIYKSLFQGLEFCGEKSRDPTRIFSTHVLASDDVVKGLITALRSSINNQLLHYNAQGFILNNLERICDPELGVEYLKRQINLGPSLGSNVTGNLSMIYPKRSLEESVARVNKMIEDTTQAGVLGVSNFLDLNSVWISSESFTKINEIFCSHFSDFNPTRPKDERYELAERYGKSTFSKAIDAGHVTGQLISDFFGKRAYNVRVLAHYDEDLAYDYLTQRLKIQPNSVHYEIHDFVDYLGKVHDADEQRFRIYLTEGREYKNGNGKNNENTGQDGFITNGFRAARDFIRGLRQGAKFSVLDSRARRSARLK